MLFCTPRECFQTAGWPLSSAEVIVSTSRKGVVPQWVRLRSRLLREQRRRLPFVSRIVSGAGSRWPTWESCLKWRDPWFKSNWVFSNPASDDHRPLKLMTLCFVLIVEFICFDCWNLWGVERIANARVATIHRCSRCGHFCPALCQFVFRDSWNTLPCTVPFLLPQTRLKTLPLMYFLFFSFTFYFVCRQQPYLVTFALRLCFTHRLSVSSCNRFHSTWCFWTFLLQIRVHLVHLLNRYVIFRCMNIPQPCMHPPVVGNLGYLIMSYYWISVSNFCHNQGCSEHSNSCLLLCVQSVISICTWELNYWIVWYVHSQL